jgi:hypothetical protein
LQLSRGHYRQTTGRIDHGEGRADGAFRIVLLCLRISEVDHEGVRRVLGDMSPETTDDVSHAAMVGVHHGVQLFRIETR